MRFSVRSVKIQLKRHAWEERKEDKCLGQISAFCVCCTKYIRERAFGITRKLDKVFNQLDLMSSYY